MKCPIRKNELIKRKPLNRHTTKEMNDNLWQYGYVVGNRTLDRQNKSNDFNAKNKKCDVEGNGMEGGDYTNKYCHDVLLGEQW